MGDAQQKKKLGVRAIAGIVLAATVVGIVVVSNLDVAGKACSDDGSLLAAIRCYEMMTGIERLLGIRSIRLANALTDLSVCYSRVPRLADAMRTQQQAIDMTGELLGDDNPAVLILEANLATYKTKDKDYKGAEQLLKGTLAKAERRDPPSPYLVGFILNALATAYVAEKNYDAGEAIARRLAEVDKELLVGGQYPFYAMETLAEIHSQQERFSEAEKDAQEALARENVGDKIVLVPAHEALGKVFVMEGKKTDARGQFDLAMKLLMDKYGDCERTQYWRARYTHLLDQKNPFIE